MDKVYVSDCCGREMDRDGQLCPRCSEHCVVEVEVIQDDEMTQEMNIRIFG